MNKDTFDQIAPGWYNYRHWSIFRTELEELARRWQKGRLLNVGCAHGPDFLPFKDNFELHGVDFSIEMLKLARKYSSKFEFSVNLVEADAAQLPCPGSTFDWAIAVATYHHMKEADRLLALRELRRVLKPGAEAFITVWNRWQPRFWFHHREAAVPWHTRHRILYRHYFLSSYHGLENVAKQAGFEILRSFPESSYRLPVKFFSRNVCLLVKKTS